MGKEDDRSIADLLLDQVEFADVILLNKTDLVAPKEVQRISTALSLLNPRATVIPTTRSQADLHLLLNTGKFDLEATSKSSGWQMGLKSTAPAPVSETEEYGKSCLSSC